MPHGRLPIPFRGLMNSEMPPYTADQPSPEFAEASNRRIRDFEARYLAGMLLLSGERPMSSAEAPSDSAQRAAAKTYKICDPPVTSACRKRRKFTTEDDLVIINMVLEHGDKKWSSIAKVVGRSVSSCRRRWNNNLNPNTFQVSFTG